MPKYEKGSQEAKDYMASLREKAKEKREALKNVKVENNNSGFATSDSEDDVEIVMKHPVMEEENVEEEQEIIQKKPRKRQSTKSKKKINIEDSNEDSNEVKNEVKPKTTRKPREQKKIDSVVIDSNPLLSARVIRFI